MALERKHLPKTVGIFCNLHDAWIVGSSASSNATLKDGHDVDVMIPFRHWCLAAAHIPPNATPTMFGGWRWEENGIQIDVWPDSLDRLASMDFFSSAWHPATGIRLVRGYINED